MYREAYRPEVLKPVSTGTHFLNDSLLDPLELMSLTQTWILLQPHSPPLLMSHLSTYLGQSIMTQMRSLPCQASFNSSWARCFAIHLKLALDPPSVDPNLIWETTVGWCQWTILLSHGSPWWLFCLKMLLLFCTLPKTMNSSLALGPGPQLTYSFLLILATLLVIKLQFGLLLLCC